jgi:hypothetical protein
MMCDEIGPSWGRGSCSVRSAGLAQGYRAYLKASGSMTCAAF